MRISDWSSDVCSSDLEAQPRFGRLGEFADQGGALVGPRGFERTVEHRELLLHHLDARVDQPAAIGVAIIEADREQRDRQDIDRKEIGRTSCRERVCKYV